MATKSKLSIPVHAFSLVLTDEDPDDYIGDRYIQPAVAVPAASPPVQRRNTFAVANDTVIELANAAAGGVSAAANFVSPGNRASRFIQENIVEPGEASQSDATKASRAQFQQDMAGAEGVGDEVAAVGRKVLRDPLLTAAQAAGSFVVPGAAVKGVGAVARGLGVGAAGITRAGLAGGAGAGAAMAGGDAAGTAYDLVTQAGGLEADATAAARKASVVPAVVGGLGGVVGAEKLLAGGRGAAGGAVARALKTGAVEGAQEGFEEGVTQYSGQAAAAPYDSTIDPTKGVAGAATMSAVMGGAVGAGTGALHPHVPEVGPLSRAANVGSETMPPPAQAPAPIVMRPEQEQALRDQANLRMADLNGKAKGGKGEDSKEVIPQFLTPQEQDEQGFLKRFGGDAQALARRYGVPLLGSIPLQFEEVAQPPGELTTDLGAAPAHPGAIEFTPEVTAPEWSTDAGAAHAPWQNYGEGDTRQEAPSPLADLQRQVREGTEYTTPEAVGGVRRSVEDQWLQENVQPAEAQTAPAASAAPIASVREPAAESEFDPTASVDARLRERRIQDGLQNIIDQSPSSAVQVLGRLNSALQRIGDAPLSSEERARVVRMLNASAGFKGAAKPAPLPSAPEGDASADNTAMEAQIPERKGKPASRAEDVRDDDILNSQGKPFTVKIAANNAVKRAGAGFEVAAVPGGFVGRMVQPTAEAEPLEAATESAAGAAAAGEKIDAVWTAFAPESGTRNVPRADMPQIRSIHRGAMTNFLNARGIEHEQDEVPARSLKPTQAEFSPERVAKARGYVGDTERSILVSADGHVLDGHHQWMAKLEDNQPVKVIRLKAPIDKLLKEVAEFPSAQQADGATDAKEAEPVPAEDAARMGAGDVAGRVVADQEGTVPAAAPNAPVPSEPRKSRTTKAVLTPDTTEAWWGVATKLVRERALNDTGFSGVFAARLAEGGWGKVPAERREKLRALLAQREPTSGNGPAAEPSGGSRVASLEAVLTAMQSNSLTSSLRGGGAELMKTDRDAILAAARKYRGTGMSADDAGRQAIRNQIEAVQQLLARVAANEPVAEKDAALAPVVEQPAAEVKVEPPTAAPTPEPEPVASAPASAPAPAQAPTASPAPAQQGKEVSHFNGKYGKGMSVYTAKAHAAMLNREGNDKGIVYAAEEHGDAALENPYSVVGRKSKPAKKPAAKADEAVAMSRSDDSVGEPQQVASVRATVERIAANWDNAPDIIVAGSMSDEAVPAAVRAYDAQQDSRGATGAVEGFFYRGKVYLVADQLHGDKDVARVLMHEALGHAGLRGVFGQQLAPILDRMATLNAAKVRKKATAYGLDYDVQAQRRMAAEEVLAEMAQTTPEVGWVKQAIAAIRTWLRDHVPGFEGMAFSDAELVQNFILPARRFVENGRPTQAEKSGAGGNSSTAVAFSRVAAGPEAGAYGDLTTDQEAALRNVLGFQKPPTIRERAEAFKANLGMRVTQGLMDQFRPIKDVSQEAYMMARLSKGSEGTMEAALLYGKPFLRDGVPDVDIVDGGFAKVLAGLKGEHDRFLVWVAAQRAERLKAEGKEHLFGDADIATLKTLNTGAMADGTNRVPVYREALREVNAFNDAVLKMAEESGLIDAEARDLYRDQPYVPFYRLHEDGIKGPRYSSGLVGQKAFQKLKGGNEKLNANLLANMLQNWSHLYSAAARNRAAQATMDAAERLAIGYRVDEGTKGAVKVLRDGVAEHWAIEDPYLLEAITSLNYTTSPLLKPLAKAKQLLTWGVTVNPTFKIRNLIRDSLSAIAQGDLSFNPLENVAKGWKATAHDSQTYASMLASGGVIRFGTTENGERVRDDIAKLGGTVLDEGALAQLSNQWGKVYAAYQDIGDRLENVNRTALYERLVAKGHSHAEASFMARDLMDFSMGGAWPAVRFLAATVPFLNARLQGLYKLGRAAKEDPRRFGTMALAVSVASLALWAAYADDEDFQKREDWDRDTYWWFKIGDQAYRIPKPFELGSVGTIAERTAELMFDDRMTGKRFRERLAHMAFSTFAMDPTPQMFKPVFDVYANKDSFTKRAIESMGDERVRPEDRADARTTEIARLLGQWGLPEPLTLLKGEYKALSPKQWDHLMRGYFGWVATAGTTLSDAAVRPLVDRGEKPAMRLRDAFVLGNFVEALPTGSSRYVSALYDQAHEVEETYASYRAAVRDGETEKAKQMLQEDGALIRAQPAVARAKRQLGQINVQAKRVEASTTLSATEKRKKLTELENSRSEVAQRVMHLINARTSPAKP